ncbi:MAG: beta-N-acetylhexosaminidase [Clostridiales bacterium]|jgi:hexosaminidase|nr:beta-N-acetylhexosaminidase [Clostridiales bacterium]
MAKAKKVSVNQKPKRKCIFRRKEKPQIYEVNLIPKPFGYQPMNGYFVINKDTLLIVDPKRKELALLFQAAFFHSFGHNLFIHYNKPGYNNILFEENKSMDPEGYTIECYPNRMKISAGGTAGFFYALQSVKQILKLDTLLYEEQIVFPCMLLSDVPKYRYRGFMIDVSRHFFDKTEIKRYIDLMASLKFNVFHWHLSDDQGFRMEIEKYPFINMTSSERKGDRVGKDGSREPIIEKTYKGFYTKEDIREVVEYAANRFVTVIPEIDVPGHVQSLIAAYPWLSCTGERVPVMTDYGVSEHVLCAGKPSTYRFVEDILEEIFGVFPGPYIHIGGDEIVTAHWQSCPHCQKFMLDNGFTDTAQLKNYFLNTVAAFCKSRGKTVIGWNDGIKRGTDADIVSQFWLEGKGYNTELREQITSGNRKVIVSSTRGFYCDYPYAAIPLKNTYFYNLPEELRGVKPENIWGYEAPLWTEYVLSRDKADLNLFPRMLAVAEQAWTIQTNLEEDKVKCKCKKKKLKKARYLRFLKRVKEFEPILDRFRVNYADLLIADPTNKKFLKAEAKKWSSSDQYSELKLNKNLREQRKQQDMLQKRAEKNRMEQTLEQAVAYAERSPIQNILIDIPYDKDLI